MNVTAPSLLHTTLCRQEVLRARDLQELDENVHRYVLRTVSIAQPHQSISIIYR